MARVLYNEGRVVGYSAYEIYTQQLAAVDPEATPANEREWLASMLAYGTSMLLRVGTDNVSGAHYRDIQLPFDSRLCAANTILASIFIGEGAVGDALDTADVWTTKVTSYGSLISNTSESSPSGATTHSSSIPADSDVSISDDVKAQLIAYMHITDGVIIQPGTWITNSNTPPEKDFQPTLSDYPMLRLSFYDKVETPFYILLTGFTDKGVVYGITDLTGSVNTSEPENGGFLGPAVFPWSAKVIFSVPPVAMKTVFGTNFDYTRDFPTSPSMPNPMTVDSTPIIDFASATPDARSASDPNESKYGSRYDEAALPLNVTALDISRASASVISTYSVHKSGSGSSNPYLPPALYGVIISGTGSKAVYPLDVVAPDTLHLYQTCDDYVSETIASDLERNAKGARAFIRDADTYIVKEYDFNNNAFIPVASTRKASLFGVVSEPKTLPFFYVQGSLRDGLTQRWNGSDYDLTGHKGGDPVASGDVDASMSTPELWYMEVDDSLASDYTLETITLEHNPDGITSVQGLSGETVMEDKLIVSHIGCMIYRRLTGKLSNKIKSECGFQNIYDNNGDPIGQFGNGGIWGNDVYAKYMFGQIDAEDRHDYYAVFPDNSNTYSFPVRSSDNFMDVTLKYIFKVFVNGEEWNIPHFANDGESGFERLSSCLGTWWNAVTNPGGMTATTYDKEWAYIHIDDVDHPTAYSAIADQQTGQVYQERAMLPMSYVYNQRMNWLFGSAVLNSSGIKQEFQDLSVSKFLQKAMYTDMGTGEPLELSTSGSNPTAGNLKLSTPIYTNGYNSSTGTYSRDDMRQVFSFDLMNTAGNSGKTQIMFIPDEYIDEDTTDPIGIVVETGRVQSFALSMSDLSNSPYSVYGTAGTVDSDEPGKITWYQILKALAENKSANVIGDNNYIEFNSSSSPLRLYVSSTEPTGTIPEGSIGIGWGSGIHTYTSGAWS